MTPLGGLPRLTRVDLRAARIGRVCLVVIIACILGGAVLLLFVPGRLIDLSRWWFFALFAASTLAWSVDWTMYWHWDRSAVDDADVGAWSEIEHTRFGFLVPFSYLLGSPQARRLARFTKRLRRRRGR